MQATVDIRDFQHFTTQNHLRASQSNDVTRILPPSSRLKASVVLPVAIPVAIFIELMIAVLVKPPDAKHPHGTRENAMMRALVLGAAALALLVGAASAQTVYPGYDGYTATAPLYDYAAPASSAPVDAAPHGYGPLVYEAQVYTPTPAYPAPPTTPGYYTALPAVASQPSYDYASGYWGR
jgi:hypothetical protein